jgi:hypothetical protein
MDALNQVWSEASTKMYEQSAASEQAGAEQPSAEADAGVEDADFTVVDDQK